MSQVELQLAFKILSLILAIIQPRQTMIPLYNKTSVEPQWTVNLPSLFFSYSQRMFCFLFQHLFCEFTVQSFLLFNSHRNASQSLAKAFLYSY